MGFLLMNIHYSNTKGKSLLQRGDMRCLAWFVNLCEYTMHASCIDDHVWHTFHILKRVTFITMEKNSTTSFGI